MAPPALNLAGSARVHTKSIENGSTPARSSRIRPGPAVVARALGTGASLEAIIGRYNRVHPSDRISTTRAIRALTVAPSIESTALRDVFEAHDV